MMQNSVWKKIKKRIRRKLKRYGSLAWSAAKLYMLLAVLLSAAISGTTTVHANEMTSFNKDELSSWFSDQQKLRAILHRIYVCGEEIVELGNLSYENVVILIQQNPRWKLSVDQAHTIMRFEEHVDDLSPHCKANAFFGIDDEGLFSLYDGTPAQEKVMKTFFQLNIPYLEIRLPKQELEHLQHGIRVRDIEEYDSVLSTFNEFRLDRVSQ